MSKETWKDYYYKNFKKGIHDVPRKAVEATFDYQQQKLDEIETLHQELIDIHEELRAEVRCKNKAIESLLQAVSYLQLFLAPGGKHWMMEKANECLERSGVHNAKD